jgi:hypothetical protein
MSLIRVSAAYCPVIPLLWSIWNSANLRGKGQRCFMDRDPKQMRVTHISNPDYFDLLRDAQASRQDGRDGAHGCAVVIAENAVGPRDRAPDLLSGRQRTGLPESFHCS